MYDKDKERDNGLKVLQTIKSNIDSGNEKSDFRFESFTPKFIREIKTCGVFLDIGAEWGFYSYLALKYGPRDMSVIAFEPEPLRFELLKEFFKPFPQVKVFPYAVAEINSNRYIAKPQSGVSATLDLEVTRYPDLVGTKIEVETVSIDDFLTDLDIGIIKMDIEGAEVLAFQGMSKVLGQGKCTVFLETHPQYIESIQEGGIIYLEKLLGQYEYCAFDEKDNLTNVYASRIILRPCSYPSAKPYSLDKNSENLLRKGAVLFKINKLPESVAVLEKVRVVTENPDFLFQANYLLAQIMEKQDSQQRQHYLKNSLEILMGKKHKKAVDRYRMGSLLKDLGEHQEAEKIFERLLTSKKTDNPLHAGILYHLGEIAWLQKEAEKAVFNLSTCLSFNQSHKKARELLKQIKEK